MVWDENGLGLPTHFHRNHKTANWRRAGLYSLHTSIEFWVGGWGLAQFRAGRELEVRISFAYKPVVV